MVQSGHIGLPFIYKVDKLVAHHLIEILKMNKIIFKNVFVSVLLLLTFTAHSESEVAVRNNCKVQNYFNVESMKLVENGEKLDSSLIKKYKVQIMDSGEVNKYLSNDLVLLIAKRSSPYVEIKKIHDNCLVDGIPNFVLGTQPLLSEKKKTTTPKSELTKPAISDESSSEKLCYSYGLNKGTDGFANCMLKIREQDLMLTNARAKGDIDRQQQSQPSLDQQRFDLEKQRFEEEKLRNSQQAESAKTQEECANARENASMLCQQSSASTSKLLAFQCGYWRTQASLCN